jgi:TPR repeat protein
VKHLVLFLALSTSALATSACLSADLIDPAEPKQTEKVNPLSRDGARNLEQRKRDCWEMPNAAACYEVGMNYELGTNVERDKAQAHEFYDKACGISDDPEHCSAAGRVNP